MCRDLIFIHDPQSWAPLIAQQCVSGQGHSWGSTVKCSHLVGPSVVLIGDAAHGVTPNLGQGCAAGPSHAPLLRNGTVPNIRMPSL